MTILTKTNVGSPNLSYSGQLLPHNGTLQDAKPPGSSTGTFRASKYAVPYSCFAKINQGKRVNLSAKSIGDEG